MCHLLLCLSGARRAHGLSAGGKAMNDAASTTSTGTGKQSNQQVPRAGAQGATGGARGNVPKMRIIHCNNRRCLLNRRVYQVPFATVCNPDRPLGHFPCSDFRALGIQYDGEIGIQAPDCLDIRRLRAPVTMGKVDTRRIHTRLVQAPKNIRAARCGPNRGNNLGVGIHL